MKLYYAYENWTARGRRGSTKIRGVKVADIDG